MLPRSTLQRTFGEVILYFSHLAGYHFEPMLKDHSVQPASPHHSITTHSWWHAMPLYSFAACLQACSSPLALPSFFITSTLQPRSHSFRTWEVWQYFSISGIQSWSRPISFQWQTLRAEGGGGGGGSTVAFQAKILQEFIKRLGDWQSDAFRSYIYIPIKYIVLYCMHAICQISLFV